MFGCYCYILFTAPINLVDAFWFLFTFFRFPFRFPFLFAVRATAQKNALSIWNGNVLFSGKYYYYRSYYKLDNKERHAHTSTYT